MALATSPAALLAATASAIEGLVARKAAILDLLHTKAEKALVTAAQDQAFPAYDRLLPWTWKAEQFAAAVHA